MTGTYKKESVYYVVINVTFEQRQALFVESVFTAKPVFINSVFTVKSVFVNSVELGVFQKI